MFPGVRLSIFTTEHMLQFTIFVTDKFIKNKIKSPQKRLVSTSGFGSNV